MPFLLLTPCCSLLASSMWNIFEQPWTGLAIAVITLNVMAVVRWFVPLERKWLFIPPATIAAIAIAVCYLVVTDREKAQRVFSQAVKAVRQQNPDNMARLIAPEYSDAAHPTRKDFVRSWQVWLGDVKLENVGTSNVVYNVSEGKATVTFNWLLRFGKQPGTFDYLSGTVLYGRASAQIGPSSSSGKWLIQSSELLEVMNRPTSWRRVNF